MMQSTGRIMLVEDESIIAMDVQQRLEALGYQVVAHATSGMDAIQAAIETCPDLILMDIKIHGPIDGIETAAQIREKQDIPVVYLTAFADENTLKRAKLTEAFGYLLKPFEDRELHSAVEIALYKHTMEKKLRVSEARYALATLATNDGIWDWDMRTHQVFFSSRWRNMLGLKAEDFHAGPDEWLDRVHPDDQARLHAAIDAHLQGLTPTLECEHRILHQDGGHRWMLCRGVALFDSNSKPYRMVGSQSDITLQKQLEGQLIHKAMHDELTGLPNRALFMDRLNIILEQIRGRRKSGAVVMFLDIDHFKFINDSLGHAKGDALLIAFSQRLEKCLRPGDTASRFGGDEFAILVDDITSVEEGKKIAKRISSTIKKPFLLEEQELFVNASIGVVFTGDENQSAEEILRDADISMYHSKNNGRSHYEIFRPEMREHTLKRLQQEGEIRRAIKDKEFILYYQPIFTPRGQEVVGFEALLRWNHPIRGLLAPSDFMEVAEQSGLIIQIGEWVLYTACHQAQQWNQTTGKPLKMSINLSPSQLNDRKLVENVRSALKETGLAPQNLELELTETMAVQNIEYTTELLQSLRQMGVGVALDDFGKGYSSLDYIKSLPSNTLKIDRSFIMDLSDSASDSGQAIVLAMVTMAHQLQLKVTAEGVETEEQLRLLKDMNCDQIQGYYMSKPITAGEIEKMLNPGSKPS